LRRSFPFLLLVFVANGVVAAPAFAKIIAGPGVVLAGPGRMAIVWQADDRRGEVFWGADPKTLSRTVDVSADEHDIFRAILAGLQPRTKYYYRVKSGRAFDVPGSFVSPGGPDDSFVFVAYGDSRARPRKHAKVAAAMLREDPALVLHTGDQVNISLTVFWREFFESAGPLLHRAPVLPTKGNHESLATPALERPYFDWFFHEPERAPEWASRRVVRYDGVCFIVLDTTQPCDAGTPQYAWLQAQLALAATAPDVKFRIVESHFPPYSISTHRNSADVLRYRKAAAPLFTAYGVDLVLSGHDHNYQRAVIDGVTYVVLGGGGANLDRGFKPQPWTKAFRSALSYLRVDVSPTQLRAVAKEPDGVVFDRFTIDARNNGRGAAPAPHAN